MPLSITAIVRHNAGTCDHITVTVNLEGTDRVFETHFSEIDALFAELTPLRQLELLVLLWAKYRRSQGRAILNVEIA